ncbi:flagellar hook-associated protein 1 FlgK [Rhodoblastus acidophilus]|uniref:flagellar hook-associated protein FlgK n=1 Tax=Rhodoblastus acidophilus TaxID=1074 RepID=UPI002224A27D|nr:flagellar hook-associated protein FlgK [Rhodoblastus acidophilus]MCW2284650.1 flagellar hook-associated protein 1 FlgK [Rhodoblastus acidophilus]MCW2333603.1 flagellar hook-associated protein 1 FlgK [Rhodoblastus acidophilus]
MWGGLTNALNTATTSLATNAGLQAVVARNVSNAQNKTGYVSAKVANVVTVYGGAGVIQSVRNLTSASLFNAMLSGTSSSAAAQALSDGVTLLQKTAADATTTTDSTTAAQSPSTLLQALTSALQTYSSSPSNASAAAAVVTAADRLVNGLNDATTVTQNVRKTADQNMATSVGTINTLLTQFQSVNSVIVQGTASGADITDALDERDTILQSLSKEIGITTVGNSNGSMSIYTDSGVTLFETTPRDVSMQATTAYSASTTGAAVYVDGVPVTGANAVMPIQSGALAGYAQLRDTIAPTYQSQLDALAGGLINAFAETNQSTGGQLAGLFTYSGGPALPGSTAIPGLAGDISVSTAVDPAQGGSYNLIRDGGINGAAYVQNTTGASGYNAALLADITAISASQTFPSGTALSTANSVKTYASESASWLNAQYQTTSNDATYQATLLSQASQALSNATGVNIDSQMSMMLEYENSYQASAKLISTINNMFGALLQAVS